MREKGKQLCLQATYFLPSSFVFESSKEKTDENILQ